MVCSVVRHVLKLIVVHYTDKRYPDGLFGCKACIKVDRGALQPSLVFLEATIHVDMLPLITV